jgi:ubiquinone/menaquinone biosynthesis C-methylase UbiE/uncharacterized protein YbaR (Trm112 family)
MTETMIGQAQDIDLTIMRCPITKQALVYRNPSLLETVDGRYAYPIQDGIFLLTAGSAVTLTAGEETSAPVGQEKEIVRDFYNNFGWKLNESGNYKDTALWTDQRTLSYEYIKWCMRRVGAYLPRSGTYLLDAGSGAIPHPVYMEYHANYARRVCVDFSIEALQEAQKKLGARGIYVLGDLTNLPFRDDAIDAVISNHVLYHVPADEQAQAFRELWRVTRPGGRAVVVYCWGRPLLSKLIELFAVAILHPSKTSDEISVSKMRAAAPDLYSYNHSRKWFFHQDWPFKYAVKTFQVVSEDFKFLYLDDSTRSILFVKALKRLQNMFPGWGGRYGKFPAIIIFK